MLTRLEAKNFKNLLDFEVDFGPFNCLAGPNAAGKSNVFDAIHFLSLLADHEIIAAAAKIRAADRDTVDLRDLFWTDGQQRADTFTLAAEMLVAANVSDDFGRPAQATSTYLRYEVEIGYRQAASDNQLPRLELRSETLQYITEKDASKRLKFPHSRSFRKKAVHNRRKARTGYISVAIGEDGETEILVHQDGGSRGNPQRAPARSAPKTIVATSNTSATPTILAARREMQKWRMLALEPSAMRRPDRFYDRPQVSEQGHHLAATVQRLSAHEPEKLCARLSAQLSVLVPVLSLEVDKDDARQVLTLQITEPSGTKLPASSLSDGTLRFLTLAIIDEDPTSDGLICMEEPENGIHPVKMRAMLDLLRSLAVDAQEPPSDDNPMRQLIIATHSPVLVQLLGKNDLLLATESTVMSGTGRPVPALRLRPLVGSWRTQQGIVDAVGMTTILGYLCAPEGAQLRLGSNPFGAAMGAG